MGDMTTNVRLIRRVGRGALTACSLVALLVASSARGDVYHQATAEAVNKALTSSSTDAAKAQSGRFSGYEIRVIYPKFIQKRNRMELAGLGTLIMNQTFIYTLMLTGLIDYHFSEMFAIEFGGSYGFSIDKEDKRILKDEFDIQTQILRTKYIFGAGLLWTPVYGKTQLPSGRLVYFDSFAHFGAGMSGIEYTYEQCITPSDPEKAERVPDAPAPTTKNYLTMVLGIGQKFFIDQETSLRWDVRDHIFSYNTADGSCNPSSEGATKIHQNVTLSLGASTFF